QESAALGGLAHLVNFSQSDTVPGILAAKKYYNAVDPSNSGPNSEHAGFCAWGRDDEAGAMRNMLEIFAENGVALLLTDTYDHENAVKNIMGGELKETIQNFHGLVGARPDSGDVVQVTSDTTEWLMETFGYTTNSKGYKVLPDFIRVVQGDGVRRDSLPKVFIEMERRGLAAENAVFGMGGGLLQHCNRDTLEFGMKANAAKVNGQWRDISKSPTGDSMKVSKAGRLALQYVDGDYRTVRRDSIPLEENALVPVFRNGQLLKKWDFTELIERSEREYPEHYYREAVESMLVESGRQNEAVAVGA
ncbi:MAG: nicotinate phosphoribosyltransferase, partial [Solirubrobacteraceae bacterium]